MVKLESFVNSASPFTCARCLRGKPCESDYYEATSEDGVNRWCKLCGDLYNEGCVDTKAAGLDMMRQRVPVLDAKRTTGGGLTADEWGEYLYSKKMTGAEPDKSELDQAAISKALGSTMVSGPPVRFGGMSASALAQEAASKADKEQREGVLPKPDEPKAVDADAAVRESWWQELVGRAMAKLIDWGDMRGEPGKTAVLACEFADAMLAEADKRKGAGQDCKASLQETKAVERVVWRSVVDIPCQTCDRVITCYDECLRVVRQGGSVEYFCLHCTGVERSEKAEADKRADCDSDPNEQFEAWWKAYDSYLRRGRGAEHVMHVAARDAWDAAKRSKGGGDGKE